MDMREFLLAVVTAPSAVSKLRAYSGAVQNAPSWPRTLQDDGTSLILDGDMWFCLALGDKTSGKWWQEWYQWPNQLDNIVADATKSAQDCNVYFSSYLFRSRDASKDNVWPTLTIQADLDDADINTLPIKPAVVVRTSPGRHQGYWIIDSDIPLDVDLHELFSRKLTYAIPKCDHSGWHLGKKVRIPNTFNYKYLEGAHAVEVVDQRLSTVTEEQLALLPEPPSFFKGDEEVEWLDLVTRHGVSETIGPQQLLASIASEVPISVRTQYNNRVKDRSAALFSLECASFRAGLDRNQVWWLAWHSANNKFSDLKFNGERELAKDVLRAEAAVKAKINDDRGMVEQARKLTGTIQEKRAHIYEIVKNQMMGVGQFIHTDDDQTWYIRTDLGRPISISPNSDWLNMLLDLQFGLNPTEPERSYVAHGLHNYTRSLPSSGSTESLSFYDRRTHSLLLHTGLKDVLRITADNVEHVTDGAYGIIFPWSKSNEPFSPVLANPNAQYIDWGDKLFRSSLDHIIGLRSEQALALLKVWFMFLLFRKMAVSRPIIAFFGQPGAGKSTLFRRIYTLLYGKQRSVTGITTADNFDMAVAGNPFVVLDNVDIPERWLPDRLAAGTSETEIEKRKLWTDGDTFTLRRKALVGISAHNPHFNREDVADRLLLFTFERLPRWIPEGDIIEEIHAIRNKLWASIVNDCQIVLRTPMPAYADVPQFRIEDFARTGYWIATALGCAETFASALVIVGKSQRNLNLEEDSMLVATIRQLVTRTSYRRLMSPGELWSAMLTLTNDQPAFTRIYKSPVALGKKLWSLQDSLKEEFNVSFEYSPSQGGRKWLFLPKVEATDITNLDNSIDSGDGDGDDDVLDPMGTAATTPTNANGVTHSMVGSSYG